MDRRGTSTRAKPGPRVREACEADRSAGPGSREVRAAQGGGGGQGASTGRRQDNEDASTWSRNAVVSPRYVADCQAKQKTRSDMNGTREGSEGPRNLARVGDVRQKGQVTLPHYRGGLDRALRVVSGRATATGSPFPKRRPPPLLSHPTKQ